MTRPKYVKVGNPVTWHGRLYVICELNRSRSLPLALLRDPDMGYFSSRVWVAVSELRKAKP